MLAQFAQENGLATIVGAKTPGRLVSRTASKLGFGYRLIIPVAAYVSAKGTQIEGKGITPNIPVPWSFPDAVAGKDNQIEAAIQALASAKLTVTIFRVAYCPANGGDLVSENYYLLPYSSSGLSNFLIVLQTFVFFVHQTTLNCRT